MAYQLIILSIIIATATAAPQLIAHSPIASTYSRPIAVAHAPQFTLAHSPIATVAHAPVATVAHTTLTDDYDPNPQYSFSYSVSDVLTGDNKDQTETRNGDVVQGSYSLVEPDGTRRIVEYTADPVNGFNAIVHRNAGTVAAGPVATVAHAPLAVAHAPVATIAHHSPILHL